jgi:LuxR family maltose regulon positive regulatory protein
MAKVAVAEGDMRGAVHHLDRAEQCYQPGFMPQLRPIPAMRARVSIAEGQLDRAEMWAATAGVTGAVEVDHRREFELLTLARLQIAQHRDRRDGDRADQALQLLEQLRSAAEIAGRRRSLVETHVLRALAVDGRTDRSEAVESLERAWAHAAEPDAHVRLFLDEGSPMIDLLREAARTSIDSSRAQRLLDLAAVQHVESPVPETPARSTGPSTIVDALSDREHHVLRLLASDLSGPEIASELFVSIHTVRTHTKRIFTKLNVSNRRAAVSRARELGLL